MDLLGPVILLKWQNFILFKTEKYSTVYICHIFFIHSSVDGHLGCLHILAVIKNAAVNTGMHMSLQISIFIFFQYMPMEWDCWTI